MKLIIDVDEEMYKRIYDGHMYGDDEVSAIIRIKKGIPYEERPQGMWEITGETDEFYGLVYRCTHCGKEVLACDCRNFCTWCGADMRKTRK